MLLEFSGERDSRGAVAVSNVCDTGVTSLWLQIVASVHCHGDVIGFTLRIMISEKEVGFFHESLTPVQVQRTSVRPVSDRGQSRKKSFRRPFPVEGSIILCFAGLEALTLL